ncbi:hypothetical protein L1887_62263 [Cichorium endivia]|nr:hypothetical protein L1887_62263 [Cichorium endivia]
MGEDTEKCSLLLVTAPAAGLAQLLPSISLFTRSELLVISARMINNLYGVLHTPVDEKTSHCEIGNALSPVKLCAGLRSKCGALSSLFTNSAVKSEKRHFMSQKLDYAVNSVEFNCQTTNNAELFLAIIRIPGREMAVHTVRVQDCDPCDDLSGSVDAGALSVLFECVLPRRTVLL